MQEEGEHQQRLVADAVGEQAADDDRDPEAGQPAAADRAEQEGTGGWLVDGSLPNVLGTTTHEQRPHVLAEIRGLVEAQPAEGVAWAQRAMAHRPDSAETLRAFTGPSLVVVGEQDALTPPESARNLAALLPNSAYRVVPGAGHLAPVEAPEAFAEAVRPWLEELGQD